MFPRTTNLFDYFLSNIFRDPVSITYMESDFCFSADCGLRSEKLRNTQHKKNAVHRRNTLHIALIKNEKTNKKPTQ